MTISVEVRDSNVSKSMMQLKRTLIREGLFKELKKHRPHAHAHQDNPPGFGPENVISHLSLFFLSGVSQSINRLGKKTKR